MNSLIFKRAQLLARRLPAPLQAIVYAFAATFWILAPPIAFLALMALAALAAWGVAWIVYDYKDRPQNWEWRAQRALAAQVVAVLQPQRTNRVYFLGLPLDLPEERFRNSIQSRFRWEDVGPGALQLNERVGLTYATDPHGIVTRATVTAEGIDEQQMIGLIGRCMGTWGNPHATAAPIGRTNRAFEAIVWRDDRALVAFDFVPMRGRQETYRMHLRVYSDQDPMFHARSDTFGLPPVHRHLQALRENLAEREQADAEDDPLPLPPITELPFALPESPRR